ncbi:inositol monophosphatase family protein, partial [Saccharomonospora saliphila]|uniref:inositol monophosphatase family protein n=1 Tax=Saccharomonospora saliphila TaxID=369829 RepID=UPI000362720C
MALMSPGAPRTAAPDPGLVSTALDVAERLAADAIDVLTATAGRTGARGADSPFDWVRDTGHTLERHTRRVLGTEFPDLPVTCSPARPGSPREPGYQWLAAPVAGSRNYVAGLPWCAYGLALADSAGPLVGVVADASRGQ